MRTTKTTSRLTPKAAIGVLAASLLLASTIALAAPPAGNPPSASATPQDRVVARVNGTPIRESEVLTQLEVLYPANAVHGSIRPEKLKELRSRAATELVVEELAYEQATHEKTVVPMLQVKTEYRRLRTKYGPSRFDASLRQSNLTTQKYLEILQRRMTLERHFRQKVAVPARMSEAALRAYYKKNLNRFQKPESVHARLFLSAVDSHPSAASEQAAREKADKVLREARAGKDFGLLTEQYSDDRYRVKGGDLGWVHKGRLDPEFETVAFSLQPGQISDVFRTEYGFNLIKVEERQPAKQIKFEEIKNKLKSELELERMNTLRTKLVATLRQGARIEVVDPDLTLWQFDAPLQVTPMAAH